VQGDGALHFVELAPTLEDAKGRVRELGKHWPGEYVIEDDQTGERLFTNTSDQTWRDASESDLNHLPAPAL
jgi:hypothetical protein